MNAQKCLDLLREIKDVAFATVSEDGKPQIRSSALNREHRTASCRSIACTVDYVLKTARFRP